MMEKERKDPSRCWMCGFAFMPDWQRSCIDSSICEDCAAHEYGLLDDEEYDDEDDTTREFT